MDTPKETEKGYVKTFTLKESRSEDNNKKEINKNTSKQTSMYEARLHIVSLEAKSRNSALRGGRRKRARREAVLEKKGSSKPQTRSRRRKQDRGFRAASLVLVSFM